MTTCLPAECPSYTQQTIASAPQWRALAPHLQEAVQVVSHVLPFRTSAHVMDALIDWRAPADDALFRLMLPQRDMLRTADFLRLRELVLYTKDELAIDRLAGAIRARMALQPERRETVRLIPCLDGLQFDAGESADLHAHPEASDVLVAGGEPLSMEANALSALIEPLLAPGLAHIQNICIDTRLVASWPQRFVGAADADALMRLFERVVAAGKSLAIMGHYSHAAELRHPIAQQAVRRIVGTGATLRMLGAVRRQVNEDPAGWGELWSTGVRLGAIPHAMLVERDTEAGAYFSLPLARAHDIFQRAYQMVSGLSRTVRGPSMNALPGKVVIDGVVNINGEKLFALQFLQARNPDWVRKPFFARFDPAATWLDQLVPAFGKKKFFFEEDEREAPQALACKVIPILQPRRRPSHFASSLEVVAA
jgi:L-lysine 2,3-aminomutase